MKHYYCVTKSAAFFISCLPLKIVLHASDYLAFVDEMIMLMTSSEVSNDDASIEALHERHSEHKVFFYFIKSSKKKSF